MQASSVLVTSGCRTGPGRAGPGRVGRGKGVIRSVSSARWEQESVQVGGRGDVPGTGVGERAGLGRSWPLPATCGRSLIMGLDGVGVGLDGVGAAVREAPDEGAWLGLFEVPASGLLGLVIPSAHG